MERIIMTRENRVCSLLLAIMMCLTCHAQQWTSFPASFKHVGKNVLTDGEYLDSALALAVDSPGITIMHIGDSHVKGKYFPNAVEAALRTALPHMKWSFLGINGACASRFYEYDMLTRIEAAKPDLVIISFGTNESHAPSYNATQHAEDLLKLVASIESKCPGVRCLLTTPPGSYLAKRAGSYRRRGRRRYTYTHTRNENTRLVANTIVEFGKKNHIAVWNLFDIAGGELCASSNWLEAGLMNADQIHYTVNGYTLMGTMLAEAVIKDYWQRIAR